jgi:hypothetical protein
MFYCAWGFLCGVYGVERWTFSDLEPTASRLLDHAATNESTVFE